MSQTLNLSDFRARKGTVHFVGCAGVGSYPLMMILHQMGFSVSGSDLLSTEQTRWMQKQGLVIAQGHRAENLPPDDGRPLLLVHTSAAAPDNPELLEAARRGAPLLRRGEALALFAGMFRRVVAVSGSHGKTSISAMTAWALRRMNVDAGFLIGGYLPGWQESGRVGNGDIFVTEVDESDGTHTLMKSAVGVVPNVEDDHSWSVGGVDALYENFRTFAGKAEHLIYVEGETPNRLFAAHPSAERLSRDPGNHPELFHFTAEALANWGRFQKMNALTALAALVRLGFNSESAAQALSTFPGVERRMSRRFDNGKYLLIEDYAHHPTELAASLEAMRELYPKHRLVVVFQPHRYARLEQYFDRFAQELSSADRVFIPPVFAAWVGSGKRSSADLVTAIGPEKATLIGNDWDRAAETVAADLTDQDLVAVIGAGDLKEMIPPLIEQLRTRSR